MPHAARCLQTRLLLLTLLCWPATAGAQHAGREISGYLHDVWKVEDGLPQSSVQSAVQTTDGYLWVATDGGLARFDGVAFTPFDAERMPEIKSPRIMTLFEDRRGALWIGTEGGGLVRYQNGQSTTFTSHDGLAEDVVLAITEDGEGALWVTTPSAVSRWTGHRFETVASKKGVPLGGVSSAALDPDGTLWFGSPHGLIRFGPGPARRYTAADGLPGEVEAVASTPDGTIWIGTQQGLARLTDGVITAIGQREGLPTVPIKALFLDRTGVLWIGGDELLARYTKGRFLVEPFGHSQEAVRGIAEDREGNLWVSTEVDGGLHRLKPRRVRVYTSEQGLPCDVVVPIVEADDGTVYAGATCAGLIAIRRDSTVLTYRESDGLVSPFVWALAPGPAGEVWIGTWGGGLQRFANGRFTTFRAAPGGLANNAVLSLYRDPDGSLWVGSQGGLQRFENGRFTTYTTRDGLVDDDVRFITRARDGALWVGTMRGLSRSRNGRFTSYTTADGLSHDMVWSIHEDRDGTLWIGTRGGGLSRFRDGRFTRYGARQGLNDKHVSRILEDGDGFLWLSGYKGITRVSRRELNEVATGKRRRVNAVTFDTRDGMANREASGGGQPAGWKSRDGRLWFPTLGGGIALFDPRRLRPSGAPAPVHIEEVWAHSQQWPTIGRVEIPPGGRDLAFHFTALAFSSPWRIQFKYRLEGYDGDWVWAGNRRTASYTNLPPGAYTFRVAATDGNGTWNEQGARVSLHLLPRWYERRSVHALGAVLLLALAFGAYRLRVRHLRQRADHLERTVTQRTADVVRERERLAETNDELGRKSDELAHATLADTHEHLLSTFDELRLGVLVLDADRHITFLSKAACRLLQTSVEAATGQSWEALLHMPDEDRVTLKKMLSVPGGNEKLTTRLTRREGAAPLWGEIDVHSDPRDPRGRVLYLYDVTETFDLRQLLGTKAPFEGFVGESPSLRLVQKQIRDVALVDTTVLIEGETGTGKELVARAIHRAGRRRDRPFIPVNCAGLTESLLASQLFGHRRGAFTGAVGDHVGFFEAANGGTLFLDEIGDIPLTVQAHLLRVLQEREITPVGDSRPRKIDVRVIAATHRDLANEVTEGRLRQDLFYRIRVATITVPPLRQRREDVPLLAAHFLESLATPQHKRVEGFSREAMDLLRRYDWPGNVRELRSAIETALINARGPVIRATDLPADVQGAKMVEQLDGHDERDTLLNALQTARGNRTAAARLLGISRATLYRRLAAHGLPREGDVRPQ